MLQLGKFYKDLLICLGEIGLTKIWTYPLPQKRENILCKVSSVSIHPLRRICALRNIDRRKKQTRQCDIILPNQNVFSRGDKNRFK